MPREFKTGRGYVLQFQDSAQAYDDEHFSLDYWRDRPGFGAVSGGRGGSCLIETEGRKAVLRRYYRGGAVAKVLSDQYLWLGRSLTRPWREWKILQRALHAGLPVPEPIAAWICRSGFTYRAALITAYLEDTEMLTRRLQREALRRKHWHRLGILIKRMHAEGIRHADLNSDNVMIDSQNRFYLLDFDRARIMNHIDDWQWRPLYRFQRSLLKRDLIQPLHFNEDDWQALMDGYES